MSGIKREIAGLDREAAKLRAGSGRDPLFGEPVDVAGAARMHERGYQWVGNFLERDGTRVAYISSDAPVGTAWWAGKVTSDESPYAGGRRFSSRAAAQAYAESLAGDPRQDYATWRRPKSTHARRKRPNVRTYQSAALGRVTVPESGERTEVPVHYAAVSVTSAGLRTACDLDGTGLRLMSREWPRVTCGECARSGRRPAICYCASLASGACDFCSEVGLRRHPKADRRSDIAYDIVIKKPDWMVAEQGKPQVVKFVQFHPSAAAARLAAHALVEREFGSRGHGLGAPKDPGGSVVSVKPSAKNPREA